MTRTRSLRRRDRVALPSMEVATSEVRGPRAFEVAGLVCGRCVGALMDALLDVPGITSVRVAASYGGASTVELTGHTADASSVDRAVSLAGFRTRRPLTLTPGQA